MSLKRGDMTDIELIKNCVTNVALRSACFGSGAVFRYDSRGRFKYYTGGYAAVFPCEIKNQKRAIRCWHTEIPDIKDRYAHISKALTAHPYSYFIGFEFHYPAVTVNGETMPGMITNWVEGMNIKNYIWENRYKRDKLDILARRFLVMCAQMNACGFAHGDLQHGNIMVTPNGYLRLLDYDSMWVPAMGESFIDVVKGLAAYQHPYRKNCKCGFAGLDLFSQLVIYTSILGVSHNPDLAVKYRFEDSEHMLFTASDYSDWKHCEIRADLLRLRDDDITRLVAIMDSYLNCEDIRKLPLFYLF